MPQPLEIVKWTNWKHTNFSHFALTMGAVCFSKSVGSNKEEKHFYFRAWIPDCSKFNFIGKQSKFMCCFTSLSDKLVEKRKIQP